MFCSLNRPALAFSLCLAAGTATVQAATFHLIGSLPGSNTYSSGYGVSDDGSVVVGHSGNNYYYGSSSHGFRWSDDTGIVDLDPLAPAAGAFAISSDGLVIAGSETSGSVHAVEWTNNGSSLTDQLFHGGEVFGLSRDGTVAVGYDINGGGGRSSGPHLAAMFGANSGGGSRHLTVITTPGAGTPAPTNSEALAASNDGSVIVGWGVYNNVRRAFRWTAAENMVVIAPATSNAYGVSGDGSVVVGESTVGGSLHAFRWTSAQGPMDLGVLPGMVRSAAYAASADGATVVGMSSDQFGSNQHAFIWRADTGMQDLNTVLAGIIPPGYTLTEARAINAAGNVFAGGSRTPTGGVEAWVVTPSRTCTPDFNGDGDLGTDADIAAFFACLGGNCCATCGSSDFNGDGNVGTDADIESFFRVLSGGAC